MSDSTSTSISTTVSKAKKASKVLSLLPQKLTEKTVEAGSIAASNQGERDNLQALAPTAGHVGLAEVARLAVEVGGLKPVHVRKAVKALVRKLRSQDDFATITAAKVILQLANAFPSKQAPISGKLDVQVSMKPFAQARVVSAE